VALLPIQFEHRDVEEIRAVRGLTLTYETVRDWCRKFGQTYANGLRRRSPRPGDRWHLDEMFIRINGRTHYLWRAVDQDGEVLDILVQSRRDKKAAKKFFRKLLKGLQYVPRVIITDKLKSYSAAKAEIMPGVEHRQHKRLNNRAENRAPADQSQRESNAPVCVGRPRERAYSQSSASSRHISAPGDIFFIQGAVTKK
jgi:putative transposase